MRKEELKKLKEKAKELRKKVLILTKEKGEGHLGGSFSIIEILIWLYKKVLKENDKFILSKGHACYPLYFLLQEKGFSPKISVHPDIDEKNGIFATTGSLGHGFPIAVGMALARKLQEKKGKIYVLVSDGELEEGTSWESALIAFRFKLDNLVIIVDYNRLQALGKIKEIAPSFKRLKNIFKNIGFYVIKGNGHSFLFLEKAFKIKNIRKPKMIILNTTKGKGVSFMENNLKWHAKVPDDKEFQKALKELS